MNKDDNFFMECAFDIKNMSTCARRQVGSVLVKDNEIISYGYNHTVKGSRSCTKTSCIRTKNNIESGTRQEFCMATHAEQMAIIEALKDGYDISGSRLYITDSPCVICSRLICEFDIAEVCYADNYPDELSFEILNNAGVLVRKINNKTKIKTKK